jgi:diadenosine tetraphosphate (Ap4A) HIT family hydrolase
VVSGHEAHGDEPTGGAVWADPAEWARRCDPSGCTICRSGVPSDVLVTLTSCWATAAAEAPLPGYVCVVSRRHVVEPFDLPVPEQVVYWHEAMVVAEAVAGLL